jgi:hypothetical protein
MTPNVGFALGVGAADLSWRFSSERVGLVQDLRPQRRVLGSGVGQAHLWVRPDAGLALLAAERVAIGPIDAPTGVEHAQK